MGPPWELSWTTFNSSPKKVSTPGAAPGCLLRGGKMSRYCCASPEKVTQRGYYHGHDHWADKQKKKKNIENHRGATAPPPPKSLHTCILPCLITFVHLWKLYYSLIVILYVWMKSINWTWTCSFACTTNPRAQHTPHPPPPHHALLPYTHSHTHTHSITHTAHTLTHMALCHLTA